MIQFNLLPDVKKQYVKAKRTKRMILSASIFASVGIVAVTALLYGFVHIAQKSNIDDLTDDISALTADIQSTSNLNSILTVQNQLSLLPDLHLTKRETSRVFSYVSFVSPETVRISTLDLDTEAMSVKLTGEADSLATIDKFVSNIKAVRYSVVGQEGTYEPYNTVLTELAGSNVDANFSVTMSYDPIIFDNTQEIVMQLAGQLLNTDPEAAQ